MADGLGLFGMRPSEFILYLSLQLSYSLHAHPLTVLFSTVDGHQQIRDQSGEDLNQDAVRASRDEMIDVELLFPPSEELFDFPAKLIDCRHLLGFEVKAVRGNIVFCPRDSISNHTQRFLGLRLTVTEADLCIEEDEGLRIHIKLLKGDQFLERPLFDPTDEMSAVFLPLVEFSVILISSVQDAGLACVDNLGNEGTFAIFARGKEELLGNALVDVEAHVNPELVVLFSVFGPMHGKGGLNQGAIYSHEVTELCKFPRHDGPGVLTELCEEFLKLQEAPVVNGIVEGAFLDAVRGCYVFPGEVILFHGLQQGCSGLESLEMEEDERFELMLKGEAQRLISSGGKGGNMGQANARWGDELLVSMTIQDNIIESLRGRHLHNSWKLFNFTKSDHIS